MCVGSGAETTRRGVAQGAPGVGHHPRSANCDPRSRPLHPRSDMHDGVRSLGRSERTIRGDSQAGSSHGAGRAEGGRGAAGARIPGAFLEAGITRPIGPPRGAGGSGQGWLRHRGAGVRRDAASHGGHQGAVPAAGGHLTGAQALSARGPRLRPRPARKRRSDLCRRGAAAALPGHGVHPGPDLATEARPDRPAGRARTCSASAGRSPADWPPPTSKV